MPRVCVPSTSAAAHKLLCGRSRLWLQLQHKNHKTIGTFQSGAVARADEFLTEIFDTVRRTYAEEPSFVVPKTPGQKLRQKGRARLAEAADNDASIIHANQRSTRSTKNTNKASKSNTTSDESEHVDRDPLPATRLFEQSTSGAESAVADNAADTTNESAQMEPVHKRDVSVSRAATRVKTDVPPPPSVPEHVVPPQVIEHELTVYDDDDDMDESDMPPALDPAVPATRYKESLSTTVHDLAVMELVEEVPVGAETEMAAPDAVPPARRTRTRASRASVRSQSRNQPTPVVPVVNVLNDTAVSLPPSPGALLPPNRKQATNTSQSSVSSSGNVHAESHTSGVLHGVRHQPLGHKLPGPSVVNRKSTSRRSSMLLTAKAQLTIKDMINTDTDDTNTDSSETTRPRTKTRAAAKRASAAMQTITDQAEEQEQCSPKKARVADTAEGDMGVAGLGTPEQAMPKGNAVSALKSSVRNHMRTVFTTEKKTGTLAKGLCQTPTRVCTNLSAAKTLASSLYRPVTKNKDKVQQFVARNTPERRQEGAEAQRELAARLEQLTKKHETAERKKDNLLKQRTDATKQKREERQARVLLAQKRLEDEHKQALEERLHKEHMQQLAKAALPRSPRVSPRKAVIVNHNTHHNQHPQQEHHSPLKKHSAKKPVTKGVNHATVAPAVSTLNVPAKSKLPSPRPSPQRVVEVESAAAPAPPSHFLRTQSPVALAVQQHAIHTTTATTNTNKQQPPPAQKEADKLPRIPASNTSRSDSYDMTPVRVPVPSTAENYNIDDLNSGDETDDEEQPRKRIPNWAIGSNLKAALLLQHHNPPKINLLFAGANRILNLSEMFQLQRRRFQKRTSSAHWDSPMWRSRMDTSKVGETSRLADTSRTQL